MADDVPTRWFAYVAAAVVLAVTAAFGGLNEAKPKLDELSFGQVHSSDQVDLSVERIALIDEFKQADWELAEPDRLAVVVSVINTTNEPLPIDGFAENLSVRIDPSTQPPIKLSPDDVVAVKPTDGSPASFVQPGVPDRLAILWAPDSETIEAIGSGAPLTVFINDLTFGRHELASERLSWSTPVPAARVTEPAAMFGSLLLTDLDDGASG